MNPQEEEQYETQQRIAQEEPPSPTKQAVIGIIGVLTIFAIPSIIDWLATGRRPGRL